MKPVPGYPNIVELNEEEIKHVWLKVGLYKTPESLIKLIKVPKNANLWEFGKYKDDKEYIYAHKDVEKYLYVLHCKLKDILL